MSPTRPYLYHDAFLAGKYYGKKIPPTPNVNRRLNYIKRNFRLCGSELE
jgi:hypothetical protein